MAQSPRSFSGATARRPCRNVVEATQHRAPGAREHRVPLLVVYGAMASCFHAPPGTGRGDADDSWPLFTVASIVGRACGCPRVLVTRRGDSRSVTRANRQPCHYRHRGPAQSSCACACRAGQNEAVSGTYHRRRRCIDWGFVTVAAWLRDRCGRGHTSVSHHS